MSFINLRNTGQALLQRQTTRYYPAKVRKLTLKLNMFGLIGKQHNITLMGVRRGEGQNGHSPPWKF